MRSKIVVQCFIKIQKNSQFCVMLAIEIQFRRKFLKHKKLKCRMLKYVHDNIKLCRAFTTEKHANPQMGQ